MKYYLHALYACNDVHTSDIESISSESKTQERRRTRCSKSYNHQFIIYIMGSGGALVEPKPFDRRVVGSTLALAAT